MEDKTKLMARTSYSLLVVERHEHFFWSLDICGMHGGPIHLFMDMRTDLWEKIEYYIKKKLNWSPTEKDRKSCPPY
jgi:hypothetical protein